MAMALNLLVGGRRWVRELTSAHDGGRGLHQGGRGLGVPLSSSRKNPHRPF